MSVFTPVTAEQLTPWLQGYALGTLVSIDGIAEGIENSNFFLVTTQGRYVLTLFEKLTRAELPFYIHLMAHLARHGIHCPAPIAGNDNDYLGELNGKPALIVTCLPGRAVEQPGVAHAAAIGAMLAQMHVAARAYGGRLANPRGPAWVRETAPLVLPFLGADDAALLRDELRFQAQHRPSDLPRGVIHADLFRDNVLFDADRIGGVIDFYFAGVDDLLFDLAVAVNDWCGTPDGGLDPARGTALLAAYHAARPLTASEFEAWPVMLRAAALRFWLSRLHDSHLPRPGELVKQRDPGAFRTILQARIAVGSALPWLA